MKQEENKHSRIQYFLWLVAGSEISVLKKCPNDYNRHANIGLMIIITSLFAGMTAFIAGSTFEKENTTGVVIFAFVWAFLIFSLDRSMVNSIKKDPTQAEKSIWGYFAPRLVLAIILSFFMSIPIEHIVFSEKILSQMDKNNIESLKERDKDLNEIYKTGNTESTFKDLKDNSNNLDKLLQKTCAECPLEEYKKTIADANNIDKNDLPPLKRQIPPLKNEIDKDFEKLWIEQTKLFNVQWPDSLKGKRISVKKVRWDAPLKEKINKRDALNNQISPLEKKSKDLKESAYKICEDWKKAKAKEKARIDSLKIKVEDKIIADKASIDTLKNKHKSNIESMQGFDTQFVTLFLMPDAGVQVLKWLIFLALLVIEILPTFLKLKTPIGQYDWEMYKADKETEIHAIARLDKFKTESSEIENYRKDEEVKMNKNLIDKVVSIEERLANEMLDEWELKARTQIKNNMNKS
jgi:Domain of unknown function (DUF4407)